MNRGGGGGGGAPSRYGDRQGPSRGPGGLPGPRGAPLDDRLGPRDPPPSMQALISTIQNSDPAVLRKLGVNDNVIDAVRSGALSDTVFIANVDYTMKWQEIKDVFKLAGRVVHVKMTEDTDGKSKGYGIVQFSSPFEALEAVAKFHGQMLKDRRLTVKMDKFQGEKGGHVLPKGLSGMGSSLSNTLQQLNHIPHRGGWDGPPMGGPPMMDDRGPRGMMDDRGPPRGMMGGGGMGGGGLSPGFGSLGGLGGPSLPSMSDLEIERLAIQREREKILMGNQFPDRGPSNMMPGGPPDFGGDRMLSARLGNTPLNDAPRGFGSPALGPPSSSFGGANPNPMFGGGPEPTDPRERELMLLKELERLRAQLGSGGDQRGPPQESFSRDFQQNSRGVAGFAPPSGGFNNSAGTNPMFQSGSSGGFSLKSEPNPALAPGFGRNQASLSSSHMNSGAGATQVFIRNLPFQVNWQMLKDRFAEFGKVLFAEIKMENGRSKGCGIVRFSSSQEAERAINMMNAKVIDGREIEVRFDNSM
jgi:heterogeneous nuclear ribonucleoprotein M